MQTNIAGLHGTRFSIRTMEALLRAQTAHFSPAVTRADGAFAGNEVDEGALSDDDSSNDEPGEVGDDSDIEDSEQ
jgi:hypothetical protein